MEARNMAAPGYEQTPQRHQSDRAPRVGSHGDAHCDFHFSLRHLIRDRGEDAGQRQN
jgi:hypothetical protein